MEDPTLRIRSRRVLASGAYTGCRVMTHARWPTAQRVHYHNPTIGKQPLLIARPLTRFLLHLTIPALEVEYV
jgi:hypothetical protein